jgi:copper(I)-binding protein
LQHLLAKNILNQNILHGGKMNLQFFQKSNDRKLIILIGMLLLILTACAGPKQLTIQDAWGRPALTGNNAAAYFVINNPLSEPDRLVDATSKIAEFTEIHLSQMQDGKMMMQLQAYVDIPANSRIEFKPKDFHIMFINLSNDLNMGDEYSLTLEFEKAGSITVIVPVKEME